MVDTFSMKDCYDVKEPAMINVIVGKHLLRKLKERKLHLIVSRVVFLKCA